MPQPHGTVPPFHYSVEEVPNYYNYDNHLSQLDSNSAQPWFSGSRSVQHNVRSPATSVMSTATAPVPRRSRFHQDDMSQLNDPIDPNLQDLHMTGMLAPGHVSRNNYSSITDSFQDGPWNPLHMRSTNVVDACISPSHANATFRSYRSGPGSIGSVAPVSDSGYHTQSVVSNDQARGEKPGLSLGVGIHTGNLPSHIIASDVPGTVQVPSDRRSHLSSQSGRSRSRSREIRCQQCGDISKCMSDYKKHELKHDKPFVCDQPGCRRNERGFTTVNDLDRHKKSVHRIGISEKSYQCASETCRNKGKIWPRLDNFKQHMTRMHKEEDYIELTRRSVYIPKHQELIEQSNTIAPVEAMIAGMDKPFLSHRDHEPLAGFNMRDGPRTTHWPANINPTDVPMNFDRAAIIIPNSSSREDSAFIQAPNSQLNLRDSASKDNSSISRLSETHQDHVSEQDVLLKPNTQRKQQKGKRHIQLSNAPQTKSQQNNHALSKLFEAPLNDSGSSSSKDLQQLVLDLLAGTKDGVGNDEPPQQRQDFANGSTSTHRKDKVTQDKAVEAMKMLASIIQQSPNSISQLCRIPQGNATNVKVCSECGHTAARACDMKKHKTRHEKPYGCTFPRCNKPFGAKSDWKRHEGSQHFQLDTYRCAQTTATGEICSAHFFKPGLFEKHLDANHKLTPEERTREVRRRRIGKNYQQQFWCGFCVEIVPLKEKRNAAWDERFDHIARHFERDKKSIDDWVCVEQNQTKGTLRQEKDQCKSDDADAVGETDDGALPNGAGDVAPPPPPPPPPPTMSPSPQMQSFEAGSRKRQASVEPPATRRSKKQRPTEIVRFCCHCGGGPTGRLEVSCANFNCNHQLCETCPSEYLRVRRD